MPAAPLRPRPFLPFLLAAILAMAWIGGATAAPVSQQAFIAAGGNAQDAAYFNKLSTAESSTSGWTSSNAYGCVGAQQFCPGTFEQYNQGLTQQQFMNSPSAQVNAFYAYEGNMNTQAKNNGYYNYVGQQACGQNGQCTTIDQSSILFACQFGCGSKGKLGQYLANGMHCVPGKSTSTNDASGVCAGDYLVKGAGYDVSHITGQQGPVSTPSSSSNPQSSQTQTNPSNPAVNASTDTGSRPATNFTPQSMGANGTMMSIGDPTICWACDAVLHAMGVAEALATKETPAFVKNAWPFIGAVFMLSLVYAMLRAMVMGANAWTTAVPMLARFALVSCLATATTLGGVSSPSLTDATGGTADMSQSADGVGGTGAISSATYATDLFLEPPLDLGSSIATDLAAQASTAIGMTVTPGNCQHDQPSAAGVNVLANAANNLLTVVCEVHAFTASGIQIGGVIVTHPVRTAANSDMALALVLSAVGLVVMAMAFQAMLYFAFAVVECILVSAVVATFLPVMIFSFAFESTRGMLRHAWDNMVYVVVFLSLSGVGGVVTVMVLLKGMSLGLGQPNLTDPASIVSAFDSQFAGQDVTLVTQLPAILKFCFFASAGALLSGRIMQGTHALAAQASGYALAMQTGLAQSGVSTVMRTASVMVGTAGSAAGIGLGAVGKALGGVGGAGGGAARQLGARLSSVRPAAVAARVAPTAPARPGAR